MVGENKLSKKNRYTVSVESTLMASAVAHACRLVTAIQGQMQGLQTIRNSELSKVLSWYVPIVVIYALLLISSK